MHTEDYFVNYIIVELLFSEIQIQIQIQIQISTEIKVGWVIFWQNVGLTMI